MTADSGVHTSGWAASLFGKHPEGRSVSVSNEPENRRMSLGAELEEIGESIGNVVTEKEERNLEEKRKLIMDDARHRIGLFPVHNYHIKEHLKAGHDKDLNSPSNEAGREQAARDFLEKEIKFYNKIEIVSSKLSPLSDILWIKVDNRHAITKLYQKAASTKNRTCRLRIYTPKSFFNRIKKLEELCREARLKDSKLRTQVRLGQSDIELYLKTHREDMWERYEPDFFGLLPDPELVDLTVSPPVGRGRDGKREREESSSPEIPAKFPNLKEWTGNMIDDTEELTVIENPEEATSTEEQAEDVVDKVAVNKPREETAP